MKQLLKSFFLALLVAVLPFMAHAAENDGKTSPANPQVRIQTNMGSIVVELLPDKAPKSVANFLAYVKDGFYDGTIFHRVIDGFMIQGGGYTANYQEKPTRAPIRNESSNGLNNDRGTIAMARTAEPNSATAQFYINVVDNPFLNHSEIRGEGYAVFGKVVSGVDTVDRIRGLKTGRGGPFPKDVPKEAVIIQKVTLEP